jgi:hypothetical protein
MKKLNFKKWLDNQGVDTELFWKNCKKKNQKWDNVGYFTKRSELGKKHFGQT